MMRTSRVLLVLAIVSLTALAGCSGKNKTETDTADSLALDQAAQGVNVKATATTGVIRGVVVDAAIRPIVQATISVQTAEKTLVTNSSATGAFGFSSLKPGTYFVKTHKAGYTDVQTSVDVKAGVADPPATKVQLDIDSSYVKPYAFTTAWKGFIQCGAAEGVTDGVATEGSAAVNPCFATGSENTHVFTADKAPDLVQVEAIWTGTQPAGNDLGLGIFNEKDAAGTADYIHKDGPSPLMIRTNATEMGAHNADGNKLNNTVRVFPGTTTATVTIQQDFTIYVTTFYGFTPKEGWMFVNDGECLGPAQCGA